MGFGCILAKVFKIDPHQKEQLGVISREFELITKMKALMIENEAPDELYKYYDLDSIHSEQDLIKEHEILNKKKMVILNGLRFNSNCVKEGYLMIESILRDTNKKRCLKSTLKKLA